MPLRGKKPDQIKKRLKVLFYGCASSGKTTSAINFPCPYIIDTEGGTQYKKYQKIINEQKGHVFNCLYFDDIIKEVTTLLSEKHPFKTLVIDPLTIPYNDLLDISAKKVGTEFGRHYGEANKSMKHLMNLLLRLDMNVVITAHAKNEYGKDLSILGQTFDCYKKLDYLVDLAIEVQIRGNSRVGLIKKSRIETFVPGETIPFSYQEISTRYGSEIIEKECEPEVLASKDQIVDLTKLIDILKIDSEVIGKWLAKASAASLDEMQSDKIQACIDSLKKKIEGE